MTLARPFSAFLICSQLAMTSSAPSTSTVAEHVRVAADELVVDAAGHVGERELRPPRRPARSGTRPGTAGRRAPPRGARRPRRRAGPVVDVVDGLEHLVGLLEQVAGEAGVGLLAVPGALGPQGAHQLDEACDLAGDRRRQLRDPQRGEVVGLDDAVEVVPRHLGHGLVGQARGAGARRPVGRPSSTRQLDVGQHVPVVALGDEQRAPLAGRLRPRSGGRRPGGRPRATGSTPRRAHARSRNERAGSTSTSTRGVGPTQQLDGALGDQRRAGHRVEHLAVLGGRGDEVVDDRAVDLVERVGRLVEVVERGGVADERGGGVPSRAQEPRRRRDRWPTGWPR